MKSTLKVEEKFGHRKSFVILKPNFLTRVHQGYEASSQFSRIFGKILRVRVVSENKAPTPYFTYLMFRFVPPYLIVPPQG